MIDAKAQPAGQRRRSSLRRAASAAKRKLWDWSVLLKHGRPGTLLTYGNGFGDHLLCTPLFRELRKRGHKNLWMMCNNPDLFANSPDVDAVVPMSWKYPDLAQRMGGRSCMPHYGTIDAGEDRSTIPDRHIITTMASRLGLEGDIDLRTYLYLDEKEKAAGRIADNQIAIQSSILAASLPIRNKEWYPERFAEVVRALSSRFSFVQVGSKNDPPLAGAVDLRGKTSIRQTAAVMSQSLAFVGLVGFLMHLARAVDCRGVIVYGGREAPWQSGYIANENLYTPVACAPCWYWSRCEHDRQCMQQIDAEQVVAALERQITRHGTPLPVQQDNMASPARGPMASGCLSEGSHVPAVGGRTVVMVEGRRLDGESPAGVGSREDHATSGAGSHPALCFDPTKDTLLP